MPPEYQAKVGLYCHDKPDKFFYPGTADLDISDLMAYHLQQTLPFSAENALKEIFGYVEVSEPGAQAAKFKTQDLAGYFEIRIVNMRYDQPDDTATHFRADTELLVEFVVPLEGVIWRGLFAGEGVGFNDPNIRLTRFGREGAAALEEAFQNAIYKMQDAVIESAVLRDYFRRYQMTRARGQAPSGPPQT
jgi:hypothetical protein